MKPVTVALVLFIAGPAMANDGRDRYADSDFRPTLLMSFPDPANTAAGYQVLERDMPGGADGDRSFRWARPEAIALVRLAAWETHKALRAAKVPMAIFDASAENGDTPLAITKGNLPHGRHPGDSHDGGLNLDLGYFLTSTQGLRFSPDYSACSKHFLAKPAKGESKDAYRCLGAPDRLDVERQAYFLARLFVLDHELFGGAWIEEVGIDLEIRKAVLKKIGSWVKRRKHGLSKAIADDLVATFNSDRWEGWAGSHHHHLHLRLGNLNPLGVHRKGFEELAYRERKLDAGLLGASSKRQVLRARLRSQGLRRSVEVELLGGKGRVRTRFRTDGSSWVGQEPASAPRTRAVLDLPFLLRPAPGSVRVQAEIGSARSKTRVVTAVVPLPRLEQHLFLAFDPATILSFAKRTHRGTGFTAGLTVPDLARFLVTEVVFEVHRLPPTDKPENHKAHEGEVAVHFHDDVVGKRISLVVARVVLSGRKVVRIPISLRTH